MAAKGIGYYLDEYARAYYAAQAGKHRANASTLVMLADNARRRLVAHATRHGYRSPLLKPPGLTTCDMK